MTGDRETRLRARLEEALTPVLLEIRDDSAAHRGHAPVTRGKGHFAVRIVSGAFEGMTLLERHRRVHAAVGDMMETDIHALSIDARTPGA